jgi:starvation-inducible DNA-binding protein
MKDSPVSPKLATPSSLGKKACDAISNALNPLVADAFALYVKSKNYHWHLSGPHFRDYHLLFDEQADQIFAMIDVLAERVRKLGGITIHSISEIAQLQSIPDDNDAFVEPKEMLKRLLEGNKNYVASLRDAHKVCEEGNDVATTSILEILIDETERRIWFLYEASV